MTDAAADEAITDRILDFIRSIGIPVAFDTVEGSVLPGMTIVDGGLVVDRDRLAFAGDLLHDAGHIAVTDPALRPTLNEVSDEPAEEMASIAWSWAAAKAIGIDPAIVFHGGGYRGGSDSIIAAFEGGALLGQPMLHFWGMTGEPKMPDNGHPPFPAMARWLR